MDDAISMVDALAAVIQTSGIVGTLIFMYVDKRQDIKAQQIRHEEEISYWRQENRRLNDIAMTRLNRTEDERSA
jgi:hypothetical protein